MTTTTTVPFTGVFECRATEEVPSVLGPIERGWSRRLEVGGIPGKIFATVDLELRAETSVDHIEDMIVDKIEPLVRMTMNPNGATATCASSVSLDPAWIQRYRNR